MKFLNGFLLIFWAILLLAFIFADYRPDKMLIGLAMFNSVLYFLGETLEAK